jgi:SAM-dependent methyltransferase
MAAAAAVAARRVHSVRKGNPAVPSPEPPPARWPGDAFRRHDEGPDESFYAAPRLVTHIDDAAIAAVTQLYRECFAPGGDLLDLMSSWVSHLPPEIDYGRVVGLGMNEAELRANPRLTGWVVHNLNTDPILPFADAAFDGAAICVSIDYLTRPVEVLREVGRVLRPVAPLVITFSNRCFPTKAVAIWHALDDRGRVRFVERLLRDAGGWAGIRGLDRSPGGGGDPLYAVVARRAAAPGAP